MTRNTADLIESAIAGDKRALEIVMEQNLGLVHSVLKRFSGVGEYEDLYQVGCMGLMRAIRSFDVSRGVVLSTYAVPAIMGEIKRYLRDNGPIKVSRTLKERSYRIGKDREALWSELGREPSLSELSEKTGLGTDEIVEALDACLAPISLDSTFDDGEGGEVGLMDSIGQRDNFDLTELKQAISILEPDDRKLVTLRFFCDQTQQQVAKALNITQVQVSRREKKILQQLKKILTE